MEGENSNKVQDGREDEDIVQLPGFRFHPTEEELVGFYLKRKVEKRPLSIQLIKQTDIYKYDPWDLPKLSNIGDKEWYFFCKRGRKYRNSIRPNRVTGTGSGFWKATGIDRPIYASGGEDLDCIGLKKSLVYYRGRAGKGTKTDWMMHEFRLPSPHDKSAKHFDAKMTLLPQEAEIWTLCRIFKRTTLHKKYAEGAPKRTSPPNYYSSKAYSSSSSISSLDNMVQPQSSYISFSNDSLSYVSQTTTNDVNMYQGVTPAHFSTTLLHRPPRVSAAADASTCNITEFLMHGADWEDLRYIVDCAGVTNSGNASCS